MEKKWKTSHLGTLALTMIEKTRAKILEEQVSNKLLSKFKETKKKTGATQ
jgi:hypothetical protein